MNSEIELSKMSYPHVVEYLERNDLIFVPFGTLEAHGRHIPIGTDSYIAYHLSLSLARHFDALVAPTLHYGITGSLYRYPAASYIPEDTYRDLVEAIIHGLVDAGFERIILFNGHGGHNTILNRMGNRLSREEEVNIMVIHWWEVIRDIVVDIYGGEGGHAGPEETAVIHHFMPENVYENLYSPETITHVYDGMNAYPRPGTVLQYSDNSQPPSFDSKMNSLFVEKTIERLKSLIGEVLEGWDREEEILYPMEE